MGLEEAIFTAFSCKQEMWSLCTHQVFELLALWPALGHIAGNFASADSSWLHLGVAEAQKEN